MSIFGLIVFWNVDKVGYPFDGCMGFGNVDILICATGYICGIGMQTRWDVWRV